MAFPDHFPYPPTSIKRIIAAFEASQADWIITTEKDAVKLEQIEELKNYPLFCLKIDLVIDPLFYEDVLSCLWEAKT